MLPNTIRKNKNDRVLMAIKVRYLCTDVRKIRALYTDAFTGLTRDAWVLAIIMFVNRSGTMVLPFLSLYLTQALHFSLEDTGWVMAAFGAGSVIGSLSGGWLTDKLGAYTVQVMALVGGGIGFFVLSFLSSFWGLFWGVLATAAVADTLRPANGTAVYAFSPPDKVTKAFSLNRMAVNLGFTVGPAVAGVLALWSYRGLFYADALTCLVAGGFLAYYFKGRRGSYTPKPGVAEASASGVEPAVGANPHPATHSETPEYKPSERKSPWTDLPFLGFVVLVLVYATVFFQLISSLPLYYRSIHGLAEDQIGWIIAFNGAVVVLFEMVTVQWMGDRFAPRKVIAAGCGALAIGFWILPVVPGLFGLLLNMGLLSVSEILAMPFMVTYTTKRGGDRARGRYLGLYAGAYSTAHILAPLLGTRTVAAFSSESVGFSALWVLCGVLAAGAAYAFTRLPAVGGQRPN
jgi:predicted MFS family arabinose efflux permease